MIAKTTRLDLAKALLEKPLDAAQIAAYLLANGRTADLEPLMRDIIQLRAQQGVVEATVVTAHPLDAASRAQAEAQVKTVFPGAKHIILNESLQPDVIGGLRLEFPAQQLDLTVRSKLSKFKQLTTA